MPAENWFAESRGRSHSLCLTVFRLPSVAEHSDSQCSGAERSSTRRAHPPCVLSAAHAYPYPLVDEDTPKFTAPRSELSTLTSVVLY
jgi:hypothetical protein